MNREVHNALFQDNPMVPGPLVEDYRREWANPNRDYFIPLREKKQDFLPKKDIKSHKLVERKYAMRRPGIYTREVDYSNMYRRLRNENE